MAKLDNLLLVKIGDDYYLRADWENDVYHSVAFESKESYDVISGLEEFVYLLRQDKSVGGI